MSPSIDDRFDGTADDGTIFRWINGSVRLLVGSDPYHGFLWQGRRGRYLYCCSVTGHWGHKIEFHDAECWFPSFDPANFEGKNKLERLLHQSLVVAHRIGTWKKHVRHGLGLGLTTRARVGGINQANFIGGKVMPSPIKLKDEDLYPSDDEEMTFSLSNSALSVINSQKSDHTDTNTLVEKEENPPAVSHYSPSHTKASTLHDALANTAKAEMERAAHNFLQAVTSARQWLSSADFVQLTCGLNEDFEGLGKMALALEKASNEASSQGYEC